MIYNDACKVATFKAPEGDYRQIVKNYMLEMANLEWSPKETFSIQWKDASRFKIDLTYEKGVKYHGVAYTYTQGCLDEFLQNFEDGEFQPNSVYYEECVGNNCSSSMNKAFQLLIDIPFRGALKPNSLRGKQIALCGNLKVPTAYGNGYDSYDVFNENSKKDVMEAYATVDAGDIIYHTNKRKSGHTRMVSLPSEVVRFENGEIDPENSFVFCIEQTNAWDKTRDDRKTTWWIDHKYSFAQLYEKAFMPCTLTIYTSGEKARDAFVIYNGENNAQTVKNGLTGSVTSNFPLAYVRATVRDENGALVKAATVQGLNALYTADLSELNEKLDLGSLEKGSYKFALRAAIARGAVNFEEFDFTV